MNNLKRRVIPCMLYDGISIVKTIQFSSIRNLGTPVQFARVYNSRNVDELIFLDITATQENRNPDYEVIEDILQECFMPVTIGGGIRSLDHILKLLQIGADKVSINSSSIERPEFISEAANKFGSQCIVVSIDVKKVNEEYIVFRDRGTKGTHLAANEWAETIEDLGAGEVFLNFIDRDGKMNGYEEELIRGVSELVKIPVIACGGAGTEEHAVGAIKAGADAVSMASLFHYTQTTPNDVKDRMLASGLAARILR
jgi:imidazole glycerol-phosphate synthase subunit HisF